MTVRIITGDCREVLRTLPDESVHCVVTSPPYWGLRDYGVENGIGLEATLAEHIDALVTTFREVRRVLRADGTLWVNYGDAYSSAGTRQGDVGGAVSDERLEHRRTAYKPRVPGFKNKDLMGLPWRLAFALQADGWWLRQDIIWSKPNPMPESVTDRCTKSHEYLFLLSKSDRYHFDQAAILEDCSPNTHARVSQDVAAQIGSTRAHAGGKTNGTMKAVVRDVGVGSNARQRKAAPNGSGTKNNPSFDEAMSIMPLKRNKRSVWEAATQPFSEAHFATFPPALIEPCIKAGCPVGGTVLDPFGGAGTTGLVAERLGRNSILIELNPAYAAMAERRIRDDAPLLTRVAAE